MSPRGLLNLALAGLAVGLGLLAWYRPGLEPATEPRPLTTLAADGVTRIEVERGQRPPLAFTRQGGGWQLAGDPPLPASPFQVRSLLAILDAGVRRGYAAGELNLPELGLAPPRARITLNGTTSIDIGDTEPLEGLRYVRHGTDVALVEDRYQPLINADRSNFIERRLLGEDADITRLVLPDLTLARSDDGHWSLSPDDPSIGADAIQRLLENWQRASALFVRPLDAAADDTGTTIRVELAGAGAPLVFRLQARSPELVLARPELGIRYHFSEGAARRLLEIDRGEPPAVPGG
jgi:hypothetical protein